MKIAPIFSSQNLFSRFFIMSLLSVSAVFAAPVQNERLSEVRALIAKRDPARLLIMSDGKPTERLVSLLKLDGLYEEQDGLTEIAAKTQAKWIQAIQGEGGKERTDFKDSPAQQELREQVMRIANEMGLFDDRRPLCASYDYAVCLGGFLGGVRSHLNELVALWKEGIRFESLLFLTGERDLRKQEGQEDSFETLLDSSKSPLPFKNDWKYDGAAYETEYDMCRLVWEQSEIPDEMRLALSDKVIFINAPRPEAKARPSTSDTYAKWIEEYSPKPGTVLAPSYPLLWSYQQLTGENALGSKYPLDTVAKAPSSQMLQMQNERIVSLVQDTLAKCLFELAKRKFSNAELSKREVVFEK